MSVRIAINGFGRIGRLVLRNIIRSHSDIEIVAINDLVPPDNLAYLLKHDSVHGLASFSIESTADHLIVAGRKIRVCSEKEPKRLPWKELDVDYVLESTGHFTERAKLEEHLEAGAKRVLLSAPAGKEVPLYVMGVNHTEYEPNELNRVVSNASCTTNCLAPLAKVLLNQFGIVEGLMTTVHAVTASQPVVDGPSKKDFRAGRAAGSNIIPASTGAAKAVARCLPELEGKLTGMAFRVGVLDVSVVDLTVKLKKETSYHDVCKAIKAAAEGEMKGIIEYCDEELVSSDFIGNKASCVFDAKASFGLNSTFYKLVAWYDNEMGYATRLVDLICHMAKKEKLRP